MTRDSKFCITHVQKDTSGRTIKVKAAVNLGNEISREFTLTKDQVIFLIKDGETFLTIHKKDGKYISGSLVDCYEEKLSNTWYLRTHPNEKKVDNLDNLPTFFEL